MRLALLLLLVSTRAWAMGSDDEIRVVAWNPAGTAVLLAEHTSHDGDASDRFLIFSLRPGAPPIPEATENVSAIGDADDTGRRRGQIVSHGDCVTAATALQVALIAHRFDGVAVKLVACGNDSRDDLILTSSVVQAQLAAAVLPQPGKTARDRMIWKAIRADAPDLRFPLKPDGPYTEAIASTVNGTLVAALLTPNAGSPVRTRLVIYYLDAGGQYSQLPP
ncbi:MAG TPA: hypothetical protein VGM88_31325 [Kofleriaceae bacterium]|jgi:hypothetical protein